MLAGLLWANWGPLSSIIGGTLFVYYWITNHNQSMNILKFGGSSVKDDVNILKVIDILISQEAPFAAVFSAMGGVTDQLIKISNLAAEKNASYESEFVDLKHRHLSVAASLLNGDLAKEAFSALEKTHENLGKLLAGVFIIGEVSPRTMDYILSFGERTSSYIIAAALRQRGHNAEYLDARKILLTNDNYGNAELVSELSYSSIRKYFKEHKATQIITGFIASDELGRTTTLGRGGSDYTAAIFGHALKAETIQIWTDVNGILSADPRKVKNAFTIPQVSYQEAMELSHFGAKVIYPPTIKPALDLNIPVHIKNTFEPEHPGSIIQEKSWSYDKPVIGISSISDMILISLEGPGMIGVPGMAARLFGALALKSINIVMITQCSSEHSITFAVHPKDSLAAEQTILVTFEHEITRGVIHEPKIEDDLCIVAVIGENMKSIPGISAKLFQSMGINGINIIAIAQGSSELNISVVIKQRQQEKALNVLHEAFFSSDLKDIHLYIVGVGLIGGTLIDQIHAQQQILSERHQINLRISGIANSRKMVFSDDEKDSSSWMKSLQVSSEKMKIDLFVEQMIQENRRNSIFVDNTSSQKVVDSYPMILDHSISISTPNKLGASASLSQFNLLKSISQKRGVQFAFETNVGAGLPVISTLQDLIKSGDKILKIEAVLSGSLSYIFNNFVSSNEFSKVVREAMEKGLTEPDPREDLNGYDVRRKILILGREAGFDLEEEEIELDFFLSENARSADSVEAFMDVLNIEKDSIRQYILELESKSKKPRMIAQLEGGKAKVGVQELDSSSPFYALEGSDNMIVFTTERYFERPLVVRGPGAGAEVTAAGVLAEIIRIANSI